LNTERKFEEFRFKVNKKYEFFLVCKLR